MDANEHTLYLKDEVYRIVGCAMEVLNILGHGLLEKVCSVIETLVSIRVNSWFKRFYPSALKGAENA